MSEEELPEGWAEATLGEMADITLGKMLDREKRIEGKPLPYLRNINVRWGTVELDDLLTMPFRDEELSRFDLRLGDLLICEGGEPGRAAIWSSPRTDIKFQKAILRTRMLGGIEPCWAMYSLRRDATNGTLEDYFTGSTIKHFPQVAVKRYVLPIPPLAEQRRIVEKVEGLLAQVNRARARLAKVPTILKRFRQSILSAACSGRLTEDWRQEDAGAGADGLPEGWQRLTVEALVDEGGVFDGPFGSNLKTSDYTQAGVRVIRMENIDQVRFIESKRTFISEEKYRTLIRHTVGEGDIIVASFVDDAVRACSLPRLSTKAIAKADCFCVRVDRSRANPRFVAMQIVDRDSYDFFHEDIHGATRPRINTKKLRQLPVPLPPLTEQHEIVRRVDALFKLADTIEAHLAAATARADKLTQAILAKAFRGELVPTEAELARQEGRDYEPAFALLARIRAEREAHASAPKPRAPRAGSRSGGQPRPTPAKRAQSGHGKRAR